MSDMSITIDAERVRQVFEAAPRTMAKKLNDFIYDGAVDIQREMRINAPTHDGQLRRSINIRASRRNFEAEVGSELKYAKYVEEGTRPHWTSVRQGSSLRKWADDKGINPYAVQRSIAMKGTKGQWFTQRTYNFNHRRVKSHIVGGLTQWVKEVDSGVI